MKQTIKTPTTVRELGELAEKLGMDLTGVMDFLDDALGRNWWNGDHEDFTVEFFDLSRFTDDEIRAELDSRSSAGVPND
jgi:hypothetical protein